MLELIPMLVPMGVWSSIASFGNTLLTPLYWVVSGILVLFHFLWAPVFGAANGWTWTLSIICLTVVIRVILIPLFVRQIHSSRNMAKVQPKVRELQKKYGSDRERLGQETMKLYREEGVNPMASCLPLLLQMPIFYALFRVLVGASTGKAYGTWLVDRPDLVESLEAATIFGARISDKFWPPSPFGSVQILTIVLILAMTATLFVTQLQLTRKNMPAAALEGAFAQQQKLMLFLFPVIFAVGGVNFPVGVLIYWVTSNLWTMGQQFYVIRRNPMPDTPAFAAWEARQRAKGVDPESVTAALTKGKSRNGRGVATEPEFVDPTKPARQQPARQQPARQQPRRQSRARRKT